MDLFTSFDGRISRKGFWLGFLGMLVISIGAGLALMSVFPGGIALLLGQLVLSAGLVYIWSAVIVKRLHDRGKPALPWAVIFVTPGAVMQLVSFFKIGYAPVELAGTQVMVPGIGTTVVMWMAMAVALWMIVELGFLKGDPGDNDYGPDPLRAGPEVQAA
ncbi:DUF805 domain-containing protein [Marinovum sp.]|uniref:DUF805 domain-containing protein n=1 Tax=Marinovum sp. TaxID=2024839 RepID=UPI003A93FF98